MKHLINFIQEGLKLGSSKINDNPEKELSSSEIMQKISFKGKAYTEACQKMEAWHKGVRKQNLKNCSNEKLKNNYWICRKMGYTKEVDQIKNEANSRGLVLEGLKLGSSKINQYTEYPKTKEELKKIIKDRLEKDEDADMNDIDVSKIKDMSSLFVSLDPLNIKIDQWDVSSVTDMSSMFDGCLHFNCDLSRWNVSRVTDMEFMFGWCGDFNADLSKWDVSQVENMFGMFDGCDNFNCDLSDWDVSKVIHMGSMFKNCKNFNSDLSGWNVKDLTDMDEMFADTPLENHPPKWFRES